MPLGTLEARSLRTVGATAGVRARSRRCCLTGSAGRGARRRAARDCTGQARCGDRFPATVSGRRRFFSRCSTRGAFHWRPWAGGPKLGFVHSSAALPPLIASRLPPFAPCHKRDKRPSLGRSPRRGARRARRARSKMAFSGGGWWRDAASRIGQRAGDFDAPFGGSGQARRPGGTPPPPRPFCWLARPGARARAAAPRHAPRCYNGGGSALTVTCAAAVGGGALGVRTLRSRRCAQKHRRSAAR